MRVRLCINPTGSNAKTSCADFEQIIDFEHDLQELGGRCARKGHALSKQATHLIHTEPLRRTEKVLAGLAAGVWILRSEYISVSGRQGR